MLTETIKYFAKFPEKAGVLKMFRRSSNLSADYSTLKTDITNLNEHSLISDIKDFVVSTSENKIKEILRNVSGYFMLLEYYSINASAPDQADARGIDWQFIVRVAYSQSQADSDIVEEAIAMDNCLAHIITIAQKMEEDNQKVCPGISFNRSSFSISPIDPELLYNKYGWSLSFNRRYNTLL